MKIFHCQSNYSGPLLTATLLILITVTITINDTSNNNNNNNNNNNKVNMRDCAELIGRQYENTCKLSFHWLVKIGDMSTCLWYEEREKGCQVNSVYGERKVQLS